MAKLKCSILLLLCAVCTLASASIKDELKFLNNEVPVIRIQRQVPENTNDITGSINYTDILNRFVNSVNACDEAFSIVCNDSPTTKKETNSLKTIKNTILNILNTKTNRNDLPSLKIEKMLFDNCMKLGEEDYYAKEKTLIDLEYIMHQVYEHINFDSSWQSLDSMLSSLGFARAFYEIKVEKDPENSSRNVITLQPPSYAKFKRTIALIKQILNSPKNHVEEENWNIWNFFEMMKRNKDGIESFLDSLLQIFHIGVVKHAEKPLYDSWQRYNNSILSSVAQINWTKEVSKEFEKVKVSVDLKYEDFLIKNKEYFLNFYDLLNSTSNNIVVSVVLTKMLAEQLPYVDWEHFQALTSAIKTEFCFEETKLYGASLVAFHNIKQSIPINTIFLTIHNIVHTMNSEIDEAFTLTTKQKKYLKNELQTMTMNILQSNVQAVADYYGDYQVIDNYFTDIRNYRKMIKNKELSTLRRTLRIAADEFYSIVDLYKPRNRFLTKLLTTYYQIPLNREIIYSTIGVDLAQFLYSLLNENKFADYKHDFGSKETQLRTYPIFSSGIIDCYEISMSQTENKNDKFIKHMLTSMFGLHIAYDAMLRDYAAVGIKPERIPNSENNRISYDKFFLISYLKSHCSMGSNLLNEIFLKSDLLRYSICNGISNEVQGCKQQPFGIQSKHIFLI